MKKRTRTARRLGAGVLVASLGVVAATSFQSPSAAAPTDTTEAEGRVLTGSLLGVPLENVAEVEGAYAADPGAPGPAANPLDLTVLQGVNVAVGGGIALLGDNGLITLGALGQYADDSVPFASSGIIGEDGTIAVGTGDPDQNSSVNLTPLLAEAGLDDLLSAARLELGAVSASADWSGTDPVGDYQIAGGELVLRSPAVAGLVPDLNAAVGTISDDLNALTADGGAIAGLLTPLLGTLQNTLDPILGAVGGGVEDLAVTATLDADLQGALSSLLAEPFVSGPVSIDLTTGDIRIDLAELVADNQGPGNDGTLNDLPVNTELIDPELLTLALNGALDDLGAAVTRLVSDTVNSQTLDVHVTGNIRGLLNADVGNLDIVLSGTLGDFMGTSGTTPDVDTSGTTLVGLLPVGALVDPIAELLLSDTVPAIGGLLTDTVGAGALETVLGPVVDELGTALEPVFTGLADNLLSAVVNVQERPGDFTDERGYDVGSFTQRAITLTLLPALEQPVELSLASATVRAAAAPGDADANTNASASAAASATADDDSNASAVAAADPAANADASTTASADADSDATAAASAAANADASTTASADVDTDANAASTAAAQAAANADASDDTNAAASADTDANASAAASAASTADSSTDASAQAAANADADADATGAVNAGSTAAANADSNAVGAASAGEDANADADSNAVGAANAADSSATSEADSNAVGAASASAFSDVDANGVGALPDTGSPAGLLWLAVGAGLLLLAGASLVLYQRRRA